MRAIVVFVTLLIAVLLAKDGQPAIAKAKAKPNCKPYTTFDLMLRDGETGPFGHLVALMRKAGITTEMREASKNKAILAPTSGALVNFLADFPHVKRAHHMQADNWDWTSSEKKKVVSQLKKLMFVDAQMFRHLVKPSNPCRLLAASHNLSEKWNGMMNGGRELYKGQFALSTLGLVGRKLQQTCTGLKSGCNYNALNLGVGYNVLTGNPGATTSNGVDPGFTSNSVFDFSNEPNVVAITGTTSCSQSNAVTTSYSYSNYQASQQVKVSGSASYGENSFSASAGWGQTTDNTNTNLAATYSGGTTVSLYSYSMPSASAPKISFSFAQAVWYILSDYYYAGNVVDSYTNQDLQAIYNSYGTSVVTQLNSGALANTLIQMSATSESSLNTQSISVSASATSCFGLASGSVSGSYDSNTANTIKTASAQGTFTYQLAPSNIKVPLSGSSNSPSVDCATWSSWLLGNNTQAAMSYTVLPLQDVFSNYRNSFTSQWPCPSTLSTGGASNTMCFTQNDVRTTLPTLVGNFLAGCSPAQDKCAGVSSTCNIGYFGTGWNNGTQTQNCTSCYTGGQKCSTTQACDGSTGACINTATTTFPGLLAKQYTNYFNCEPWSTTSGQTVLQTTATNDLSDFGDTGGSQNAMTWQLTGYFVPKATGTFQFALSADNCGFMWMDNPGNGGARQGTPSAANVLVKSGGATNTLTLNGGQAYPIRIQYGNAPCNCYNPSHLTVTVNGAALNTAQGTFYYYATTADSATLPGY